MNQPHKKQEVLLMLNSTFASRQWAERKDADASQPYDAREELEQGCWNGLIREVLPEIFARDDQNRELTLWNIREAGSFLELELGEAPGEVEKHRSVNPYHFFTSLHLS